MTPRVAEVNGVVHPAQPSGAPVDSMAAGRVPLVATLRMLGHASLVVRSLGHRRFGVAALLGTASLVTDAYLVRRLRDPSYMPGYREVLIDAADVAAWTRWGANGSDVGAQVLFATSTPTALSMMFRAAAGTEALPVYDHEQPWPPQSTRQWARAATLGVSPVMVPVVASLLARPRRRSWVEVCGLLAPGVSAATLTFVGVRHRAHLQATTTEVWRERTRSQVERERTAMRTALATSTTIGHDFKKTLFALGMFGSQGALDAAKRQAARPADVVNAADGSTLKHLLPAVPIEPLEHQRVWIDHAAAPLVEAFVDDARSCAVDGANQTVLVETSAAARTTTIRYLGASLVLRNEPPPFLARLYPTAPALFISAFWKASAVLPVWRGLPPPVALGGALIDVALGVRLWGRAPDAAELRSTVAIAAVNNAVGMALSATPMAPGRTASGDPALAASPYLMGMGLLISSHWNRLTPWQRALLPTAFAGWLVATQVRRRVPMLHVLAQTCNVMTPVISAWRLTDRLDGEAAIVDAALAHEFNARCEAAQHDALQDELDEYREQLHVARAALVEVAAELDDRTRHQIELECDELEEWIGMQADGAADGRAMGSNG